MISHLQFPLLARLTPISRFRVYSPPVEGRGREFDYGEHCFFFLAGWSLDELYVLDIECVSRNW